MTPFGNCFAHILVQPRADEEALAAELDEEDAVEERDEMDDLMEMDMDEIEQVSKTKKKRRAAGFAVEGGPPAKAARVKGKTQPKNSAVPAPQDQFASSGATSAAAASASAVAAGGGSSSAKGVKKELDQEMQIVANKHMSTESGSSIKALEGLVVPNFLVGKDCKRYSITARVRGVSRHCFVQGLVVSNF